jgi:hypothetical protein
LFLLVQLRWKGHAGGTLNSNIPDVIKMNRLGFPLPNGRDLLHLFDVGAIEADATGGVF